MFFIIIDCWKISRRWTFVGYFRTDYCPSTWSTALWNKWQLSANRDKPPISGYLNAKQSRTPHDQGFPLFLIIFKPKVQSRVQYSSPFVTFLKLINPLHIFKLIYLRYVFYSLSRLWFYKKIFVVLSVWKFIDTLHFWPVWHVPLQSSNEAVQVWDSHKNFWILKQSDVAGLRPATSWGVHYTTSCNTQSSAPEDG